MKNAGPLQILIAIPVFLPGVVIAATPAELAEDVAALVASGAGALMPDIGEPHIEDRGILPLTDDFPAAFRSGLVLHLESGVATYPVSVQLDAVSCDAIFFNANGIPFYLVPRVGPANWLSLRRPLLAPDNPWYAPDRVVAVWTLVPEESLDDLLAVRQPTSSHAPPLRSSLAPFELDVTNLMFTAISVSTSNVVLDVAWPMNAIPPDDILDLYFHTNLASSAWDLLATADVSGKTNATFTINGADLPGFINDESPHIHDASCIPITNIIQSVFMVGEVETNITYSCATTPPGRAPAGFFRVGTRQDTDGDGLPDAFETMVLGTDSFDPLDALADHDGDGLPNIYEFIHGTNPMIPDWSNAPKVTVGGSGADFTTLYTAFATSEPYDIIEIQPGVYPMSGCSIPSHPVLLSSPDGGRQRGVVLHSNSTGTTSWVLGAADGTGHHSVIQGISVELAEGQDWQTAFWWGGSLDYSNHPGAAGCFRNVEIRLGCGSGTRIGWFVRHSIAEPVLFAGCVVDAEGAASARGVYAVDSPELVLENCSFRAFPDASETAAYAIQMESTAGNIGTATNPVPVLLRNCLFDGSFTNAYALAPLTNGVAYAVTMDHCLIPSLLEFPPNEETGTVTASVSVDRHGHLPSDHSPAIGAGVASLFAEQDIDGEPFASPPSIGADEWSDGAALDSDGDGLTNADEATRTHTDPFRKDTDEDGYDDFFEDEHGSDPLERLSFCFTLSVSVGNATLYGCTNAYLAAVSVTTNGTATILGESCTVLETPNAAYDFGHILSDEAEPNAFQIVFFLDANYDGLPEDVEIFATIPFSVSGHAVIVETELSIGDADNDGMPDLWEIVNGLFPTNALDAAENPDGDGLVNLHEYWTGCNPWMPDGSNTLLSVIATSIDSRIAGKTSYLAKPRYINYTATAVTNTFLSNPLFWANDIELSCVSPWNNWSGQNHKYAQTCISPRHTIFASHHKIKLGTDITFLATNGIVYTRTLVQTNAIPYLGTDISIGLLDAPLPPEVIPAKLLPTNFADYIRNGRYLPVLRFDQEEKGVVDELWSLPQDNPASLTGTHLSNDPQRLSFWEEAIIGDSSNPRFFLVDNEKVLLNVLWFAPHGDGCVPGLLLQDIQATMNSQCPGYSPQVFDFSHYPLLPTTP